MSGWESNEEIQIFREYLRIASVHPDIDYSECPIIDFGATWKCYQISQKITFQRLRMIECAKDTGRKQFTRIK